MTLDDIRNYLKEEKAAPRLGFDGCTDIEEMQRRVHDWYVQCGRESMIEDILQWEQGLSFREALIARKKGIL
jgi:hypothetical protein